jgi:hypothetical protein
MELEQRPRHIGERNNRSESGLQLKVDVWKGDMDNLETWTSFGPTMVREIQIGLSYIIPAPQAI